MAAKRKRDEVESLPVSKRALKKPTFSNGNEVHLSGDDSDDQSAPNGTKEDVWKGFEGPDGKESEEAMEDEDEEEEDELEHLDKMWQADLGESTAARFQAVNGTNGINGFNKRHNLPTTQEMRVIKEANDLYKSTTFKLKIDAFLPTLRPPESKKPAVTTFLHSLRAHILGITSIPPSHPLEAARSPSLGSVVVPYPTPTPTNDTKWKVQYEKPAQVAVIGSWATGIALSLGTGRSEWSVDLGVMMPADLFDKKDYLNARFFHKRAFYLAVLAANIASPESKLGVDVTFECPTGDERRTLIVLRPSRDGRTEAPLPSNISVHIHVLLPSGPDFPFPLQQLSPSHSSLRMAATDDHQATPVYNSVLLSHAISLSLLLTIHQFTKDIPCYRDAVALVRAWAARRGFDGVAAREKEGREKRIVLGWECRGAWWACLVGGCVQGWDNSGGSKARLARGMSSYQLFRGAMDFLATHSFEVEPILMKTKDGLKFPLHEFSVRDEAAFVDSSSTTNLLSGVPLSSLTLLRREAAIALKLLDEDSEDAFDALFLRDISQSQMRFDAVIRVDFSRVAPLNSISALQLDYSSHSCAVLHSMATIITRALTTRAEAAAILRPSAPEWDITTARPSPSTNIYIGITFNSEHFARLVDHGPPAEDPEGAELFREFWGEKSELRRFKDGSILESVVWDTDGPADRVNIPSRLVLYVLQRHFRLQNNDITLFQPMLDSMLKLPHSFVEAASTVPETGLGFKHVLLAYDLLVRELKAMDDLPLALLNVSATSEALRYTSPFPPVPVDLVRHGSLPDCARFIESHDIILEFEASAKWPDDLVAAQKVKLAFFEQMARNLMERLPDARATVALDAHTLDMEDNCALEVLMPNGIAFRARIHHNRERTLLERLLSDTQTGNEERKRAALALSRHHNQFVERPRHHAAVATLQHTHPAFSPTVRLIKRWLSAHLLGVHIPIEAVELVCASVFLCPGPFDPPNSLFAGFSRAIYLLSTWNWSDEPLLVPLYTAKDSEMGGRIVFPRDGQTAARSAFAALRIADPGFSSGAWFIATELDAGGIVWSRDRPSVVVCNRIKQLAMICHAYLGNAMHAQTMQIQTLFSPPLEDYDFVLHLEPAALPRYYQYLHADENVWLSRLKFRNLRDNQQSLYGTDIALSFDAVSLLLKDLQMIFGDCCVLFHDAAGGDKIGGIWNPSVLKSSVFKVLAGFTSRPQLDSSDQKKRTVVLNVDGILNEMARCGAGLVQRIVTR